MVHSLSAVMLAQTGRYDEANAALRQAERMASILQADDVLATVYGNQANVALIRHRYEQALALAERAVTCTKASVKDRACRVALATLGQICVRVGNLDRADAVLHRALDVRSAMQFHETTGAVYDTLAQMSLMRGDYENAAEYLRQAAEAYGAYGRNTSRWYEWSLRVISARLATRRGKPDEALAIADEIAKSPTAPPAETIEAELIAAEALLSAGRVDEAEHRLTQVETRLDPRTTPGAWGEFLRLRGDLRARQTRTTEAYHDIAQSSSVFELVGERYQAAVSQLALARLAAKAGAKSTADRHYQYAAQVFQALGATRDLEHVRAAMAAAQSPGTGEYVGSPADADDALVRRLVDAAVLPDLLARELAATLLEAVGADVADGVRCSCRAATSAWSRSPAPTRTARTSIARLAVQGGSLRRRRVDRRTDRPRPDGPRTSRWPRRGRPLGHPQDAAGAHDGRRRAAGLRLVWRARSPIGSAGRRTSSARSSRCCLDSSAPAPRCTASSIRFSGCRATTSPC